ncbi:MAG: hypothetical protein ACI3VB_03205 [Oscillospiraceae bacterium]
MIDLNSALEIARKYYDERGMQDLTKVYDAENAWIIYAGKKDQPRYGNAGISIDKETGDISSFVLPSRRNFEILKNATLIELE